MRDDEGYEVVGTSRRHWLLRPYEHLWEVWVIALVTGAFFAGLFYLSNRSALVSLLMGAVFVLAFGVTNALRFRRAQSKR